MRGRAGDKMILPAEGTRLLREAVDSTRRVGIASNRSLSVGIPSHRRR